MANLDIDLKAAEIEQLRAELVTTAVEVTRLRAALKQIEAGTPLIEPKLDDFGNIKDSDDALIEFGKSRAYWFCGRLARAALVDQ